MFQFRTAGTFVASYVTDHGTPSQSFEHIHRSNLVGMGVLLLQFEKGQPPSRSPSTAPRPSNITEEGFCH